ncbi:hypothetical protein ACFPMF_16145 [Larkinella bovis]|uniref:Gasdermin bGSDM n=1 Tax=Larkinella bovis TaxID=683041 RepID=A0ABW0IEA0_9BACT
MFCKDQSITFLKSFGYNVVRVPKADIQPLQILSLKKGILNPLGELSTLLLAGNQANLTTIRRDIPTANISGQKTSELSLGVGIAILGSIIGAMGGSKLGLETKYSQARTITFEYADVLSDTVEIAALDQFLADADVNPLSQFVSQMLEADDIYVITAVIKSKKFSVEAKKKNGTNVEISIPEIKGIVGGDVSISGQNDTTTKVTFEGPIPLIFGFQAIRLIYEDGKYTAFKSLDAGGGALSATSLEPLQNLSTSDQENHEYLILDGGLTNL